VHEKNMILNVYKNPLRRTSTSDGHSFHPELNGKSVELAREGRDGGVGLFQLGEGRRMEKE
jgi:hypothetical protein